MLPCSPLSHAGEIAPLSAFSPTPTRISLWRAATLTHPFSERGCIRKRAKFLARAIAQRQHTHRWLSELTRSQTAALWAARPRLSTKLQRPYLCSEWRVSDRLNALADHYRFLPRVLHTEAMRRIYGAELTLLHLSDAASGRRLAVRLFYRDQFEKEGDLTLSVDDVTSGLTLAGITFSVVGAAAGERRVMIGGLQASPGPQTRVVINEVSKEMHGMRPKAFALWCLQELCSAWSISEIYAVADEQHIYRHAHKRREFSASYNEFWAESDGTRAPNGFWQLPLRLRHRAREELKASRRKAHERRYAMLSALQPELRDAVTSVQPNAENCADRLANPPAFSLVSAAPRTETAPDVKENVTSVVVRPLRAEVPEPAHTNHSF